MSRVNYNDDGDDWSEIRWHGALKRAVNSKRGQALLHSLYDALIALPSKRLISNHLSKDGDVCALGALASYQRVQTQGISWDSAKLIEEHIEESIDWWDGNEPIEQVAKRFNAAYTLIWTIIEQNECIDVFQPGKVTPEERYKRVLSWIQHHIK